MSKQQIEKPESKEAVRIKARRMQRLRVEKGMKQSELAEKISKLGGEQVTPQLISCWETGYRPINVKYNYLISEALECDLDYLTSDEVADNPADEKYAISKIKLKKFDKQPVYVVFDNLEHSSGWAIYNDNKKLLLFADFIINCNEKNLKTMKFYTTDVNYFEMFTQGRKKIDIATALTLEQVYINVVSTDPIIKARYDGWYKPMTDKKGFINSVGIILPMEGFGITYHVFKE